ncbi:MAG: DUF4468 domain-containing protein [Bacteroidales bacterium]|jgi:hypothetical protein|nr:DUF4468 domain-containing protein [Bacteroidales bacterium]
MKKLLAFLLFLLPIGLSAQTDSKYLAGAVKLENGKVVFNRQISVEGLSSTEIFKNLDMWLSHKNSMDAAILYKDSKKGLIICRIIRNAKLKISLFPSNIKFNYQVSIAVSDGKCDLKFEKIKYIEELSDSQRPAVYSAEDYITDKDALNKKKTKVFKGIGQYRIKTIDFVNNDTDTIREILLSESKSKKEDMDAKKYAAIKSEDSEAAKIGKSEISITANGTGFTISPDKNNGEGTYMDGSGRAIKFITVFIPSGNKELLEAVSGNNGFTVSYKTEGSKTFWKRNSYTKIMLHKLNGNTENGYILVCKQQ